ncbi:hypothetical protein C0J52_10047 [Blattella germanica]|nr:hypothetical protein C0J52_10047 [Blattella germanica]
MRPRARLPNAGPRWRSPAEADSRRAQQVPWPRQRPTELARCFHHHVYRGLLSRNKIRRCVAEDDAAVGRLDGGDGGGEGGGQPEAPRSDQTANHLAANHSTTGASSSASRRGSVRKAALQDDDDSDDEKGALRAGDAGGGGFWGAASRPSSPMGDAAGGSEISSSVVMPPPSRPKSRVDHGPPQSKYSNLSYWRARKVLFYKNGDPFFPGVEFRFKPGRDIVSLESLLDKLSLRMDLPRGARYVFSMDGDRKLRLEELEDGASYVVSSYKTFKVRASPKLFVTNAKQ